MQNLKNPNFSINVSGSVSGKLAGKLEEVLGSLLFRKGIHHAILAIENGDRSFRWVGTAGDAQPGGEKMRQNTPFFIASVTKLYIAAAVLKLSEQAVIGLDHPVMEYLPESLVGGIHRWNGVDYTERITIDIC